MSRRIARLLTCIAVAATLLVPAGASAAEWDPIPELPPGEHAAVAQGVDGPNFDPMRACLREFESAVDAEYFAVVVEVTAENGRPTPQFNDAVPYVDATYQKWKTDERIAPDTHNIIALGLENRAVAIHPGNRWVDLGFERGAVTETIDNSDFKSIARNGDYAGAVCHLAEAVDRRLEKLVDRRDERQSELVERADGLVDSVDSARQAAREIDKYGDPLAESLADKFDRIERNATEGRDAARRERLSRAESKLQSAENLLEDVRNRIATTDQMAEDLDEYRQRIQTIRSSIEERPDSDWELPRKAQGQLDDCETDVENVEQLLEQGKLVKSDLRKTEACLEAVDSRLDRADDEYAFWTRTAPMGGGGLLVVLLIGGGVWRRRQHSRHARMLDNRIENWEQKLANASTRLNELERDYGFYFFASTEEWEGDSKSVSQSCANAVNRAFLLYAEAEKLLEEARELRDSAGFLSVDPLEEGLRVLEDKTIEVDTGVPEERRRVFLPLTETYSGTANQVLDDLDTTYRRAVDKLDKIEELMNRVGTLSDKSSRAVSRADEALEARRKLDLPVDHLLERLDEARQTIEKAQSYRDNDPVRAVRTFDDHLETVREAADRAEQGNEMVRACRGRLTKEINHLGNRVADLRDRSYDVAEPDFDPDLRLERLQRDTRRVVQKVGDGDEQGAADLFETLEPNLEEVAESLDVIESAPSTIPTRIDELERRRTELADRLPEAREILEDLRERHAPKAFDQHADNLDQLSGVLEDLEEFIAEIRTHHDNSHYLAATADIETAEDLLNRGNKRVDELEEIQSTLRETIDEARSLKGDVREKYDEMRRRVDERAPAIPQGLGDRVEEFEAELGDIDDAAHGDRPNWLEIRERLKSLGERLERTRPKVDDQIGDYQKAREMADELEGKLEELRGLVGDDPRTSTHVDNKLEAAQTRLEKWREQLADSPKGGSALLRRAKHVKAAHQRARDAWQSELELIETWEKEHREVQRRLEQEDSRHLGYSVYVDCSAAYSTLKDAESAADDKSWETALDLLDEARQQIEWAVDEAHDEYEHERDMRSTSYSSTSSSYGSSTSFGSSSTSTGTSFSSSSSSAGSSFGGTSSGGSSFGGSSSGGSDFGGTSSGGSSW